MALVMKRLLALLTLAILFASRTAAADENEADEPKGPAPKREWYGWQTLATDGVSFTMMGLGLGSIIHEGSSSRTGDNHATSGLLLGTGFGGYLLGAPAVHAAHGHWGKAGGSFAMRSGPIALCAVVAAGSQGSSSAGGACAVVLFFGVIATVAVDSAVIAREDVVPPPPSPQVSLAPSYDPKTRTGSVSFAAEF
jgi:opacity protein-like surface antigen